jgi:hypothetical protein
MDRIGNYLALKFGLSLFRINADVGSITRTAAVSKGCGCSGGPPWITCDYVDDATKTGTIAFFDVAAQTANIAAGGGVDNQAGSTTVILATSIASLDVNEYIKSANNEYMKVTVKSGDGKTLTVTRNSSPPGLTSGGLAAAADGSAVTLAEGGVDDQAGSTTVKLVAAISTLVKNDYIKSAANEYMKVTAIADSGKTLTVQRAASPQGLTAGAIAAAPAGTTVTLATSPITKGPSCPAGEPLAAGSCSGIDQTLQVITGPSYLDLEPGIGAKSPTVGGNFISIKGMFVLPTDVNRNDASGVFGTADYTKLDTDSNDRDTFITSQYLAVSVGHVPYECRAPYSTLRCLASDFVETFATDCRISMKPSAGTVDGSAACASWVAPSPMPEIKCRAPAGIGAGQDLLIYWHGVATVLSNWFRYESPIIQSLVPASVSYQGGTITVKGFHFGNALNTF